MNLSPNLLNHQNGIRNASDQSGPWVDVFAIFISSDFGRSLHFIRCFCCFVICKFVYSYFQCKVCSKPFSIILGLEGQNLKYSVT